MSATGTRSIIWANGEDVFCIAKVGLILDLEDKCKAGFAVVMARLEAGAWGLNDVREPIRLGLIGGGMKPDAAMAAVRRHVDENPLAHSVLVAYEVMRSAMFGIPVDDPVGVVDELKKKKRQRRARADSTMTTAASGAPK
jgi:hypothetical protein